MSLAVLDPIIDTTNEDELDDSHHTHIVWGGPDSNGAALVMEARINGTPIVALCGYTWVPSRDTERHPLCSKCKEIFDEIRDNNDNVNKDPEA